MVEVGQDERGQTGATSAHLNAPRVALALNSPVQNNNDIRFAADGVGEEQGGAAATAFA